MKVTVIGYWGGFPGANEATSGYLFQHDGFNLLVDCGSGVMSKLQNYLPVEDLDAVILSHYHHDHIADIGVLQYGRMIARALGKKVKELPIMGHKLDQGQFSKLSYKNITTGAGYDHITGSQAGPFSISFLKTKHPVDCFAMRIEAGGSTVVFTADSSYQDSFIDFSRDADLLICECNLYSGMDGSAAGHMTSTEAGKIAGESGAKQLLLTHLPHFGRHEDLMDEAKSVYGGKVELARTGYIWES